MTVLSDTLIRERIAKGELVPGGDPVRASECSYSFRPGRGFIAGDDCDPIEFQTREGPSSITVQPGKMVWVRTSDRVSIPNDVVGFWWQTNTLSRKGLMLVNMSMVEPGYNGDLACLFVNFGNGKVIIEPETVIAKMVFVDVRGTVAEPFKLKTSTADYDAKLRELAANQPGSFLQVGDLATDLSRQREEIVAELRRVGADAKAETARDLGQLRTEALHEFNQARTDASHSLDIAKGDAVRGIEEAKSDAVSSFKEDAPKAAWKTLSWAAAALALLTLVNAGGGWLKDNVFPDGRKIAKQEAEEVLRDRTTLTAGPRASDEVVLQRRLDELNARLAKLEKGR